MMIRVRRLTVDHAHQGACQCACVGARVAGPAAHWHWRYPGPAVLHSGVCGSLVSLKMAAMPPHAGSVALSESEGGEGRDSEEWGEGEGGSSKSDEEDGRSDEAKTPTDLLVANSLQLSRGTPEGRSSH